MKKLTEEQKKRLIQILKIILAFNSNNILEMSPDDIFDRVCWALSKKEEPERIKKALEMYFEKWEVS